MPIYEYKCKKGHVFDAMQSFSDEPLTKCEVCGAPVQRVYHPVSVHFKGSGFYNTDYGPSAARARRRSTRNRPRARPPRGRQVFRRRLRQLLGQRQLEVRVLFLEFREEAGRQLRVLT